MSLDVQRRGDGGMGSPRAGGDEPKKFNDYADVPK